MTYLLSVLLVATTALSLCHADLPSKINNPWSWHLARVRRQTFGQPNLGYGGGISMTVSLNPSDRVNPINFADSVHFGYGVNSNGINQANNIGYSNTIGNAKASGNSFGGAGDGFGYGGGNANTLVAGSPGFGQAQTNNFGFSGSSGNGFGTGGATGQVIPFGRR